MSDFSIDLPDVSTLYGFLSRKNDSSSVSCYRVLDLVTDRV